MPRNATLVFLDDPLAGESEQDSEEMDMTARDAAMRSKLSLSDGDPQLVYSGAELLRETLTGQVKEILDPFVKSAREKAKVESSQICDLVLRIKDKRVTEDIRRSLWLLRIYLRD